MNTNEKDLQQTETSLIKNERGASFIEKLVIIGLFVIAAAAGVTALAGSVTTTLTTQGTTLQGMGS